jgi:hypothetical protein
LPIEKWVVGCFEYLNDLTIHGILVMRRRSSTGDAAQNALRVVEQGIGAHLKAERKIVQFPPHKKNPAAVTPGKLGGMKGGRARAAKLSPEKRKEIAQPAAQARWGKSRA